MCIPYLARATRHSARALLALLGVAIIAACGGSYTASTDPVVSGPPVTAATVQATPSNQFTPNTVTIAVGGTVTVDFGSVAHNVFFDNAPAGAPADITAPSSNKSTTLTFNQAGTFVYDCHIHPGMHGTVVVK
ncbi:MAG TPA: plastocyanin/azurin family copper-binding protein [Gemmatimonadaceae bacterium]|jgi:plastocyanin|nr:plastocyanin/azurin family copper-binding protein [Gemmatimonadaceae bacterium]